MKKGQATHSGMLLLTATIWGFAFVAQSVGNDYVGPFTFTAIRCVIGSLVLLPVIFLWRRPVSTTGRSRPYLLQGGLACGVVMFVAANLQQVGLMYTTVGKAGFITTFYIILVPLLSLLIGRHMNPWMWPLVGIALVGLYLISVSGSASLEKGDALVLLSALLFAVHILVIDYFSPFVDGVRMSCLQFFVCGLLSALVMLFTETPTWAGIQAGYLPILYAGVLSNGVAYTLQILGQKGVHPTLASMILSLESSIAVLGGWLFLREMLTTRELLGCLILFVAIILAQLLPQEPDELEGKREDPLAEQT